MHKSQIDKRFHTKPPRVPTCMSQVSGEEYPNRVWVQSRRQSQLLSIRCWKRAIFVPGHTLVQLLFGPRPASCRHVRSQVGHEYPELGGSHVVVMPRGGFKEMMHCICLTVLARSISLCFVTFYTICSRLVLASISYPSWVPLSGTSIGSKKRSQLGDALQHVLLHFVSIRSGKVYAGSCGGFVRSLSTCPRELK